MKNLSSRLQRASALALTFTLLFLLRPLAAEDAESGPIITVNAVGEAEAAPDLALITVIVKEQQDTVAEARAKKDTKLKKVQDALTLAGVKEENLRILPPSVYVFSPGAMGFAMSGNMGTPKTQLVVSSTIIIEIPNPEIPALGNVWKALEAALDAGAEIWSNEAANYMPQFTEQSAIALTIKDKEALKLKALNQATSKAMAQAEAAASGLGMKLGELVSTNVDGAAAGAEVFQAMEVFGAGSSKSACLKKITVSESVTVSYRLTK